MYIIEFSLHSWLKEKFLKDLNKKYPLRITEKAPSYVNRVKIGVKKFNKK